MKAYAIIAVALNAEIYCTDCANKQVGDPIFASEVYNNPKQYHCSECHREIG